MSVGEITVGVMRRPQRYNKLWETFGIQWKKLHTNLTLQNVIKILTFWM